MEKYAKTNERYKVITISIATITLFVGGMIYLIFRPTWLLMFEWINIIHMSGFVEGLRQLGLHLPEWAKYSLPDGLWTFSYTLCIGCIWDFELRKCWTYLILLFSIVITDEILQLFHYVPGSFDILDLLFYISFFLLGLFYIIKINILTKQTSTVW